MTRKGPWRLTSSVCRQVSGSISAIDPEPEIPALLTTTSSRPPPWADGRLDRLPTERSSLTSALIAVALPGGRLVATSSSGP